MSAPNDGRIGEAKVKLGNLVGPAAGGADSTELATVQQLDPMGVDVQVSSRYLDRATKLIGRGLPVTITRPVVEGVEDYPYPGRAVFIDNTIDPNTSTFLIRSEVANPQKTLLPGEYVKVKVTVDEKKGAIVVPEQAVIETQAGPTVYVVDKDGTVKVVPVKASITEGGLRVIDSGLVPGQKVIVEGLQLVRPGMKVKTEPMASPSPQPSPRGGE
jgi:membrane fusion protein (multidrug efflux system)